MDTDAASKCMKTAITRDPRRASFGYLAGEPSCATLLVVFSWFESIEDMVNHLINIETALSEFDEEEKRSFVNLLSPLLRVLPQSGLTEDGLAQLNEHVQELDRHFLIFKWWGNFQEIVDGQSELAKKVRGEFRRLDPSPSDLPISTAEIDRFVEYLPNFGH